MDSNINIAELQHIAALNAGHGIYLVQDPSSRQIYVEKQLALGSTSVYEYLIEHPVHGTPRIYSINIKDNRMTVLEEYISGTSLLEILKNGPLPADTVKDYTLKLCDIVEALHSCTPAIIHRDIKPSNILITEDGRLILLDFDAARLDTKKPEDTMLLGTQGFAAPEQYGFGSSDQRTDIYSIGVLVNAMLTGDPKAVLSDNSQFKTLVETCTNIDPSKRYGSVSALKEELLYPTKYKRKRSYNFPFLPPGFRTLTPLNMFVATAFYTVLFYIMYNMTFENASPMRVFGNKLSITLILLTPVVTIFNYLDIQRIMPLCKSRKLIVRILGIFLLTASLVVIGYIPSAIIDCLFG